MTDCCITGCADDPHGRVICRAHYRQLPEDVQERLHWAVREGDDMDIAAAIRAAKEELE